MKPLEGIRVLDFSQAMMAPLAAMMLGDMGADVIKIERLQGEAIRHGRAAAMDDIYKDELEQEEFIDHSIWLCVNRSKRSLPLDVRQEEGREIALKLIQKADVMIQNFRPGVIERLRLDYKTVSEMNPGIIYCSVYGFGEIGPLVHRIGGDMWSQAMSGMVSLTGTPNGAPTLVPFLLVDHCGGILTAYAIMMALFIRERTGVGQEVVVNQLDTAMWLQTTELSRYLIDGEMLHKTGRGGTPPRGAYPVKDGDIATIFGLDPLWGRFCQVLGLEHLIDDPRFKNDEARSEHAEELYPLLDEAFGKKTRAEWQQLFREARLRCDPALTYEELCSHPQTEANDAIVSVNHLARGKMKMLNVPFKLRKTPVEVQVPPPLLGQHSREILAELGYTPTEMEKLREQGIVKFTKSG